MPEFQNMHTFRNNMQNPESTKYIYICYAQTQPYTQYISCILFVYDSERPKEKAQPKNIYSSGKETISYYYILLLLHTTLQGFYSCI